MFLSEELFLLFAPRDYVIVLDTFTTAFVAGAVNGTKSDNNVSRTVVDTDSKLTIGAAA